MAEVVERKKKTRGRQKIEMKLIPDKEDRVITFSKRKAGIFKKASEISVMCGAKVLFILFSPVGKAYSFGHPSVKSVAEKFYGREETGGKQIREILEAHLNNRLENQVAHHQLIKGEIEAINGQVSALADVNKFQNKGWWEANINEINSEQELKQMLKSIQDLQAALSHHFENLKLQNAAKGSNVNPVDATYDPVRDVNKFLQNNANVQNHQMANWNGGDLPGFGGLGEFDNSVQGVNVGADPSAVGFAGDTAGLPDYPLSLPEAGFGGGLGQVGDYSLPAACGGYDSTFGTADAISGWSGLGAGYEGFFSGTGPPGVGTSGAAFGDPVGLSGVGAPGAFFGDPGDSLYASGFGDNFMNGLPDFP